MTGSMNELITFITNITPTMYLYKMTYIGQNLKLPSQMDSQTFTRSLKKQLNPRTLE